MLTITDWKFIRNALKAASEMQGIKRHKHVLDREDSFLKKFSTRNHQDSQNVPPSNDDEFQASIESSNHPEGKFVIQHDGSFMFYWLGVMTLAVLYNIWTCIARQAFKEIQQGCTVCWYSFDAVVDFLYICDILVQFRTGYLDQGLMVYDSRKLYQKYIHSRDIYIDFVCLLPLDFIQFGIGVHPMIRFPRFLKVYRTFRFIYMLESRTNYPNLFRVANLTHLVLLGSHWFAAFYYMISEAEEFKGGWSYPNPIGEFADISRKYLQSLYWATLTLTTIGDLPHPTHANKYIFVIGSYLIGVFVFATIVGQVGNVINNRNASRIEFERLLDGAKVYMQTHNVPHNLQKRVQRWYDYVWSRGRLNGCDINSLGLLPDKLKTELAIHVNLETLKKVTIFHECQPEFLHDLVLKMKAYIFTPGDLICRKGEVAREMFIIADGVVEIISENGMIIKRMGAGDFFGEIGILNLDGGINRRSADVRSVGYLELFVLSREDVLEALKDHPEAESVIRDYGQRRLRVVEAHRQKHKHFKTEGIQEEPENHADTPQSTQNRFMQTLKSWNSAVKKQSSPVPPSQVSSPSGNTADLKRFVTHRGLSSNDVSPSGTNSNANPPTGLSIVSVEKPDLSTGFMGNRFSENSTGKTKNRIGYFRIACAQLKNVFNRRKGRRWSMGVSDSPRRKFTEQRLLLKPADDQAVTVDLSTRSCAFMTGCHVTVNIEDCSVNNQVREKHENCDEESRKSKRKSSKEDVAMTISETDGGSVSLHPGLSGRKNSTSGQSLGRGTNRKLSDPVSYVPVATEDLDEKYSSLSPENRQDRTAERQSQIILDVGKIGDMWKGVAAERGNTVPEAYITYHQPSVFRTSPSPVSVSQAVTGADLSLISNIDRENVDKTDDSNIFSPKHGGTGRSYRGNHEVISTNQRVFSSALSENSAGSVQPGSILNTNSCVSGKSRNESSDSSSKTSFVSPREAKAGRTSSSTSIPLTDYSALAKSRTKKFEEFHVCCKSDLERSTPIETASEHFSSSQAPFGGPDQLSPSCETADHAQTATACNHSISTRHKNNPALQTDIPSTSASKTHHNPKVHSLRSNSVPERDSNVTGSCAGHTIPTKTLQESLSRPERGRTFGTSFEPEDIYVLDEFSGHLSPRKPSSVSSVKQDETPTIKRQESTNSGRSKPMSIIQQLTTDIPYQNLASEINVLQGMIDKRLTLLEEAFMSTSAQLDRLAASQDVLVQLLLRQMDGRQPEPSESVSQDDRDIIYKL